MHLYIYILSGDPILRSALDKYENGDAHDLEGDIYIYLYTYECLYACV
jgi:hypothetical protein